MRIRLMLSLLIYLSNKAIFRFENTLYIYGDIQIIMED